MQRKLKLVTRLHVQSMGVGESGMIGQAVSCNRGSALGKNSVEGNATTQNLNMGGSTVKEVQQKQKVASRQPNVLWIASAKNGRTGGPAPSHAPTVELPPASTRVSRLRGGSAWSQRTGEGPASSSMATSETRTGPAQRFRLVPSTAVGTDTQIGVHATRQLG